MALCRTQLATAYPAALYLFFAAVFGAPSRAATPKMGRAQAASASKGSQTAPPKSPAAISQAYQRALQLTRAHRYAEAEKALRGVPPPTAADAQIAYFRLRASIASGLGKASQAADDMEVASKLAP